MSAKRSSKGNSFLQTWHISQINQSTNLIARPLTAAWLSAKTPLTYSSCAWVCLCVCGCTKSKRHHVRESSCPWTISSWKKEGKWWVFGVNVCTKEWHKEGEEVWKRYLKREGVECIEVWSNMDTWHKNTKMMWHESGMDTHTKHNETNLVVQIKQLLVVKLNEDIFLNLERQREKRG